VFVENRGEVLVLSGIGLDVEDVDHNEIFLMEVKQSHVVSLSLAQKDI